MTSAESSKPITIRILPADGPLPEVLACSTANEQHRRLYESFRKCIEENRNAEGFWSSLPVAVYVVASQWERLLLVRHPGQTALLRTCRALRSAAFQAFRLSLSAESLPQSGTGRPKVANRER